MWLSLILLVLLVGITIRQAAQGLFSALIMVVLTVCCAAAALGTYEWAAIHWLAPHWKPSYALPIALGVTFGVPLVLLHTAFAQVIKRASLLPAWGDRLGAGVCGFVTAMTMVGILALCLQMLPFDRGVILGYAPIALPDSQAVGGAGSSPAPGDRQEKNLFLSPDRFVVSLATVLSGGVFSGDYFLGDHDPDLVQTIHWVGAAKATVSRFAPPNSISVVAAGPIPLVYRMTPGDKDNEKPPTYEPVRPKEGYEFQMVRVRLQDAARDEHHSHRFTLRQFRLVGRAGKSTAPVQYHPMAVQQEDSTDPINRHIRERYVKRGGGWRPVTDMVLAPREGGNQVEIVFELPVGFQPSFLEYKRSARAAVSFSKGGVALAEPRPTARRARRSRGARTAEAAQTSQAPPPKPGKETPPKRTGRASRRSHASKAPPSPKPRRTRRGGNVRAVTSKQGQSRFSDELPVALRAYQRFQNVEISGGRLVSGHVIAELDRQEGGTGPEMSKFAVPSDKRLLQLSSVRLHARSGFGRALSFAVATVQNYFVEDDRGRRYKIVGKYAIAEVRGKRVFEVEYASGPTGSIGGLGKFARIDEKKLKPTDEFVLLFLVDPGARITSFSSGGAATRRDDLTMENLVAPP